MYKALKVFEKTIIVTLLLMMMLAVLLSTIELGHILYVEIVRPPMFLLNIQEMLEVFGFFLMVLIGLELLETIKAYLQEDRVHAEVVFLVALVAVARKVIILEHSEVAPMTLVGMAVLIVSLGACYYMVRKALRLS